MFHHDMASACGRGLVARVPFGSRLPVAAVPEDVHPTRIGVYKLRLRVTTQSPLNRGRAILQRKPYDGLTCQLVLAFDIGTTYSGISFCILQPGEILSFNQ